jgi:hypothetical protein
VFLALIVALMGRAEHVNIHGRVETVKKRTQLKKFIFLQGLRALQSHVPAPIKQTRSSNDYRQFEMIPALWFRQNP